MRLLARGLSAAALLLVPLAVTPSAAAALPIPTPATNLAPLRTHGGDAVSGQYIVSLSTSLDPAATARKLGFRPMYTYDTALRGFATKLDAAQLDTVRRTPGVESVEENATVRAYGTGDAATGTAKTGATRAGTATTGTATTGTAKTIAAKTGTATTGTAKKATVGSWGLDRIDQRDLPLDGTFTTVGDGQGATAYIVDTGIDYGHSEFGGRAVPGYDAVGDGRNGQDCEGHGTHVAGTVGGATYGVAPKATLVSVRVLGCDGQGSEAAVIAGFDWVAKNAEQPAVLNASLGGEYSAALNQAANAVADAGVLPVVAAGNSAEDACGSSPASATGALAVGASDQRDQQTNFSNFGKCVTLYAPGKSIVSAKLGGGSVALDGTSMASPHVAGVALLYKAQNPDASPQEVTSWITDESTKDVLTVSQGSPNRLLFTGGL